MACFMTDFVRPRNYWSGIIVFLDGAVNLTAVQYSIAEDIRWNPICCCPLRYCKCTLEKIKESFSRISLSRTETDVVAANYVRIDA